MAQGTLNYHDPVLAQVMPDGITKIPAMTLVGPDGSATTGTTIVEQDAVAPAGSPYSASSVSTLFSIDTTGYNSTTVSISGTFTATVLFETSNDLVNWQSAQGTSATSFGNIGLSASAAAAAILTFPAMGKYLRARVSAWTSGTVTAAVILRSTPMTAAIAAYIGGAIALTANPTDGTAITVTSLSAVGTLFTSDTTNYRGLLFQVSGTWVATIVFEGSDDNVNWLSVAAYNSSTPSFLTSLTASNVGVFIPTTFRYIRARVSAWTSGTITGAGQLRATPFAPNSVSIGSSIPTGANKIGNVGLAQDSAAQGNTTAFIKSAASNNGNVIKASAGNIFDFMFQNLTATDRYVHFYNSATLTMGTTQAVFTLKIPANGAIVVSNSSAALRFLAGIAYSITAGVGDLDATAIAAGDVQGYINWA